MMLRQKSIGINVTTQIIIQTSQILIDYDDYETEFVVGFAFSFAYESPRRHFQMVVGHNCIFQL